MSIDKAVSLVSPQDAPTHPLCDAASLLQAAAQNPAPGPDLISAVRAGLTMRHTSLERWCRGQGIQSTSARMALAGSWNGPKARRLRRRLLRAAGLELPQ